jgi:hypothetical protein
MIPLAGKRALFVGGSSGVGLATAQMAGAQAAAVTVASRSAEKLREAKSIIDGDIPEDVAQQSDLFMTNPFATGSIVLLDGGGLLVCPTRSVTRFPRVAGNFRRSPALITSGMGVTKATLRWLGLLSWRSLWRVR